MRSRSLFELVLLASITMACGGSGAEVKPGKVASAPAAPKLAKRSASLVDDCAEEPGKPAPEPLRIAYDGVAKSARCQREVYTIMGGLTHFLGVECKHCHLEPDYAADTHNKHVANWMAQELVPRLRKRGANGQVWCVDCHQGKPKILGNPRNKTFAIEWMTTHLVDELEAASGKNLKCRQCHDGDLGTPQFRQKIILSELTGLPAPPPPAAAASAAPAPAPSSSAAPVPDLPDYGAR